MNDLLFDCALRGLGILNFENDRVSGERHFVDRILPKLVEGKNPFFVDVGANVGDYSEALSKRFPHCRVLALEPQPDVFRTLLANLSNVAGLQALNLGAGAEAAELTMYSYAEGACTEHASLYADVFSELRPSETRAIAVQVDRLDRIVEQNGYTGEIDLVKIDTEGHELEVLRGATELLRQDRIRSVQIEFNDVNAMAAFFSAIFATCCPIFRRFGCCPIPCYRFQQTAAFRTVRFSERGVCPSRFTVSIKINGRTRKEFQRRVCPKSRNSIV